VQEFEFAVPTPATIGEYLLQTRTRFETNSNFCASLVISVKHRHVCSQNFSLVQIRPILVRLVGLNLV